MSHMVGNSFFGSTSFNSDKINAFPTTNMVLPAGAFGAVLFNPEDVTTNPYTQSHHVCAYSTLVHSTVNSENNATWGNDNVFKIKANGDLVSSVVIVYLFKALHAKVLSSGTTVGKFPVISSPDCPFVNEDNSAISGFGGMNLFLESIGANPDSVGAGPNVTPCTPAADPFATYTVYIGLFAAAVVELKSGDNVVDSFSGSSYLAMHELTGDVEARHHLAWGGATLPEAIELSETDMHAYVKTQFTLTADLGSSLALCASLFTMTEMHIHTRTVDNVIIRSAENVEVEVKGAPIKSENMDIGLDVMYIILDDDMRAMYQQTQYEVIVVRAVAQTAVKKAGGNDVHKNLNVKGFLLGLIVFCRREAVLNKNIYNHFEGVAALPPVKTMQLVLDGQVYIFGEGSRFSKAHPAALPECNIPEGSVYLLSFTPMFAHNNKANSDKKHMVVSGLNANTVDDVALNITFQESLVSETVQVTTVAQQLTFAQYKNSQLRLYTSS